ncbi:MAG: epoxyqueuosine reductase [Candidatus Bathyarchaeota archaeon]|nr:epoxyqueuosine reductase [Candidatus Bathyarchaeota archaeon]
MQNHDHAEWITQEVKGFAKSSVNSMQKWNDEPAWGTPIVGFSSGGDPLFQFYKQDIGEFYRLPLEFLANQYPENRFDAQRITIISWILPQTEATKRDHRQETYFPSERWARSRIFGEGFNNALRQHMVDFFHTHDIQAIPPLLSPLWESKTSVKYGYASTWSERHATYASGLGTFGLSDGLITPVGKAMRTGSVIVNLEIEPTLRPYDHPNAYCLFHMQSTCGQCMTRCPINAITEEGHNKMICRRYVQMTRRYVTRHYGFKGYGCGFCQTAVPCESGIPEELQ